MPANFTMVTNIYLSFQYILPHVWALLTIVRKISTKKKLSAGVDTCHPQQYSINMFWKLQLNIR
jgi:hypothetical protein